jgi:hypothetical protein
MKWPRRNTGAISEFTREDRKTMKNPVKIANVPTGFERSACRIQFLALPLHHEARSFNKTKKKTNTKTKLRGLSPRANYIERGTAGCR